MASYAQEDQFWKQRVFKETSRQSKRSASIRATPLDTAALRLVDAGHRSFEPEGTTRLKRLEASDREERAQALATARYPATAAPRPGSARSGAMHAYQQRPGPIAQRTEHFDHTGCLILTPGARHRGSPEWTPRGDSARLNWTPRAFGLGSTM
mmetsp:Transcript_53785/g.151520  ORF Transcript_53785/g.151520 Transcript_53785/m.151520 type:complete len:153 (+) Transcript_53785:70-528(+)